MHDNKRYLRLIFWGTKGIKGLWQNLSNIGAIKLSMMTSIVPEAPQQQANN